MGQARGDRRRQQLLDATLRVIAARGIAAVSHREVAREAGAPLGSTTYYFRSKTDIVAQALERAAGAEVDDLQRRVDELALELLEPEQLAGLIVEWLDQQLRGARRQRTIALYALQLESVHTPGLRRIYERWTLATLELARRLLEASGASQPQADAPLLVAALDGLRHNQLVTERAGAAETAARAVVGPLVASLLAPERTRG